MRLYPLADDASPLGPNPRRTRKFGDLFGFEVVLCKEALKSGPSREMQKLMTGQEIAAGDINVERGVEVRYYSCFAFMLRTFGATRAGRRRPK
jgi:hypothetical protein